MSWFTLISNVFSLLIALVKFFERGKIVAETEQLERARVLIRINQALAEASQVPAELRGLSEEELDTYVQAKGWYRD